MLSGSGLRAISNSTPPVCPGSGPGSESYGRPRRRRRTSKRTPAGPSCCLTAARQTRSAPKSPGGPARSNSQVIRSWRKDLCPLLWGQRLGRADDTEATRSTACRRRVRRPAIYDRGVGRGEDADDDPVIVRFEFTKAEFEAAMRAMLIRLIGHRLLIALGLGLVAVGVGFLAVDNDDHAFIIPGLIVLGYVGLAVVLAPKWGWTRAKGARGEQRYAFDADGMTFKTPVSESKLSWGYFPVMVESRRFYFFRSRGRICNPIPRRAFADGDEARFRALVGQHIETRLRPDLSR